MVVLSDAMYRPDPRLEFGYSRVAYIVWIPLETGGGKLVFAETVLPQDMLEFFNSIRAKATFITQAEAVGMAAAYFSPAIEESLRGRDILHFADNRAANAGFINGYSRPQDTARIVSGCHMRWATLRVAPWIEFVKSEANAADLPSRGEFGWLLRNQATRIEFVLPPYRRWDGTA